MKEIGSSKDKVMSVTMRCKSQGDTKQMPRSVRTAFRSSDGCRLDVALVMVDAPAGLGRLRTRQDALIREWTNGRRYSWSPSRIRAAGKIDVTSCHGMNIS